MFENIQSMGIGICEWDSAPFLLFSDNVFSNLIYYSHLLPAIVSILFGILIFINDRKHLVNRVLLFITGTFTLWALFDLILWASERIDYIMFFWSSLVYLEPLIYIGCYYLVYLFIHHQDLPFKEKLCFFISFLPILILAPTAYNLTGFDFTNCEREAIEGPLWYYVYALEGIIIAGIAIAGIRSVAGNGNEAVKRQNILITMGTILFLLTLSFGNITGSFSLDWSVAQYGLFGMPVFIAFLAYLVIRYQRFNTKVIATQILIGALWVLIFSVLFVEDIELVRIIVGVTFVLALVFGNILNLLVAREIRQRQEIEKLAKGLEISNEQQSNLLHFITHQVKGFFTKSRNIFSTMLEGEVGPVSDSARRMLQEGLASDTKGINTVQEILNASNIRTGTVTYDMQDFDLSKIVLEVITELTPAAAIRGVKLSADVLNGDHNQPLIIKGDHFQIRQAIKNLVDNSIRYTPQGTVSVSLETEANKVRIIVKDTGIGISPEDRPKLFTEGGRGKDSRKINVESTGYGLYIVKNVVEAHKGHVWVQSEGQGKGSTFTIELPA